MKEVVVPIGKYVGQTVTEIAMVDPGYLNWMSAQPNIRDRHPEVIEAIEAMNGGTDTTPAHNRMQERFLDDDFCARLFNVAGFMEPFFDRAVRTYGGVSCRPVRDSFQLSEASVRSFEKFCDVSICGIVQFEYDDGEKSREALVAYVELKPTIGDEYPKIMRQMAGQANMGKHGRRNTEHLVLYTYDNVSSVSDESLRKMFAINDIHLVIDREEAPSLA